MAGLAIEPPSASDAPLTRAALGRSAALRSTALVMGALALVLGAALLWRGAAPGRDLAAEGDRVPGTVTQVAPQRVNGGGNERGLVTFEFELDGARVTATNLVGGTIMHYSVGEPVEVVVRQDDLEGARLSTELDRPGWEVPGVILLGGGAAAIAYGTARARALRRIRRCLDAEPWMAVMARLDHVAVDGPGARRAMGVVAVQRAAGERPLVVITRGLRRFTPTVEPVAWVAGWGGPVMVLSPEGGGLPLEIRPVRTAAPRPVDR
jgi:hypothetical protein